MEGTSHCIKTVLYKLIKPLHCGKKKSLFLGCTKGNEIGFFSHCTADGTMLNSFTCCFLLDFVLIYLILGWQELSSRDLSATSVLFPPAFCICNTAAVSRCFLSWLITSSKSLSWPLVSRILVLDPWLLVFTPCSHIFHCIRLSDFLSSTS